MVRIANEPTSTVSLLHIGFRITDIEVSGLPDSDKTQGSGAADPCATCPSHTLLPPLTAAMCPCCRVVYRYIKFTIEVAGVDIASACTPTVYNARNVKWPDDLVMTVPGDFSKGTLRVAVADDDSAEATLNELTCLGRLLIDLTLTGRTIDRRYVKPSDRTLNAFQLSFDCKPMSVERTAAHEADMAERAAAVAAAEKASERSRAEAAEAAAAAETTAAVAAEQAAHRIAEEIQYAAALSQKLKNCHLESGSRAEEAAQARTQADDLSAVMEAVRAAKAKAQESWLKAEEAVNALGEAKVEETATQEAERARTAMVVAQEASATARVTARKADNATSMAAVATRRVADNLSAAKRAAATAANELKWARITAEEATEAATAARTAVNIQACKAAEMARIAGQVSKNIRIRHMKATGLPDFDKAMGRRTSDPYAIFTLETDAGVHVASTRSATVSCARNVEWPDDVLLVVPGNFSVGKLMVTIADDDSRDGGDNEVIGRLVTDISPDGRNFDRMTIKPTARHHYAFKFSFFVETFLPHTAECLSAIDCELEAKSKVEEAELAARTARDAVELFGKAAATNLAAIRKVIDSVAQASAAQNLARADTAAAAVKAAAAAQMARTAAQATAGAVAFAIEAAANMGTVTSAAMEAKEIAIAAEMSLAASARKEAAAIRASQVAVAKAKAAAAIAAAAEAEELATAKQHTLTERVMFIAGVELFDIPDFDKGMGDGTSDPFVEFIVEDEAGSSVARLCTPVIKNTRHAKWSENFLLEMPAQFTKGKLRVTAWDDNSTMAFATGNEPEFMAQLTFDVDGSGYRAIDRATLAPNVNRFATKGSHKTLPSSIPGHVYSGSRGSSPKSTPGRGPKNAFRLSFNFMYCLPGFVVEGPKEAITAIETRSAAAEAEKAHAFSKVNLATAEAKAAVALAKEEEETAHRVESTVARDAEKAQAQAAAKAKVAKAKGESSEVAAKTSAAMLANRGAKEVSEATTVADEADKIVEAAKLGTAEAAKTLDLLDEMGRKASEELVLAADMLVAAALAQDLAVEAEERRTAAEAEAKVAAAAAGVAAAEAAAIEATLGVQRARSLLPKAPRTPRMQMPCTPLWVTSSARKLAPISPRTVELAVPRHDAQEESSRHVTTTALPPITYGRDSNCLRLGDPTEVGDLCIARSVEPGFLDRPVVLTSPRLSPRYRVPSYMPATSCRGSAPPVRSPRSARVATMRTPERQLYDAAFRGDVRKLQQLTTPPTTTAGAAGSQPTGCVGPTFSNSPLDVAVRRGQAEAVRVLLTAGAFVNARDKFGCSPLHAACRLGDELLIRLLLAGKADPTAVSKQGFTPYEVALTSGQCGPAILKTLEKAVRKLEQALPVQKPDLSSPTPLPPPPPPPASSP